MANNFWNTEGMILVNIMPHGHAINSDLYTQTLRNLQKRFRKFHSHQNFAEILLKHYKA
jgi:Transposase.